jgi:hypothetical protein
VSNRVPLQDLNLPRTLDGWARLLVERLGLPLGGAVVVALVAWWRGCPCLIAWPAAPVVVAAYCLTVLWIGKRLTQVKPRWHTSKIDRDDRANAAEAHAVAPVAIWELALFVLGVATLWILATAALIACAISLWLAIPGHVSSAFTYAVGLEATFVLLGTSVMVLLRHAVGDGAFNLRSFRSGSGLARSCIGLAGWLLAPRFPFRGDSAEGDAEPTDLFEEALLDYVGADDGEGARLGGKALDPLLLRAVAVMVIIPVMVWVVLMSAGAQHRGLTRTTSMTSTTQPELGHDCGYMKMRHDVAQIKDDALKAEFNRMTGTWRCIATSGTGAEIEQANATIRMVVFLKSPGNLSPSGVIYFGRDRGEDWAQAVEQWALDAMGYPTGHLPSDVVRVEATTTSHGVKLVELIQRDDGCRLLLEPAKASPTFASSSFAPQLVAAFAAKGALAREVGTELWEFVGGVTLAVERSHGRVSMRWQSAGFDGQALPSLSDAEEARQCPDLDDIASLGPPPGPPPVASTTTTTTASPPASTAPTVSTSPVGPAASSTTTTAMDVTVPPASTTTHR